MTQRLLQVGLVGTALVFFSPFTWACAVCLCGDPTLTLMGTEKPFAGRSRVSLDYLIRTENSGVKGLSRKETDEQRLTLGLSYTPNRRATYSIAIPWVEKQLTTANLSTAKTSAVGDITLNAKFFLQPDQNQPKHMYGVSLGLTLPTASEQKSANGAVLDIDVQPSSGSTIPKVGAWYAHFAYPYLFYVSSVVSFPDEGDQGFDPGTSLVNTFQTQYSLNYQWALQLNLDTRWSQKDQYSGVEDDNSGGFLAYLSPGIIMTLKQDLLLQLRSQIPVIDQLRGTNEEDQTFSLGLLYDF